jgi:hypothetical protein
MRIDRFTEFDLLLRERKMEEQMIDPQRRNEKKEKNGFQI